MDGRLSIFTETGFVSCRISVIRGEWSLLPGQNEIVINSRCYAHQDRVHQDFVDIRC